jgi:hypothetical protein
VGLSEAVTRFLGLKSARLSMTSRAGGYLRLEGNTTSRLGSPTMNVWQTALGLILLRPSHYQLATRLPYHLNNALSHVPKEVVSLAVTLRTYSLDLNVVQLVDDFAVKSGAKKSHVVRDALLAYLGNRSEN